MPMRALKCIPISAERATVETIMKSVTLAGFLLLALSLVAAEVSGRWSGSAAVPSPDGPRNQPVYLVIRTDGSTATGTIGESESENRSIENGRFTGDTLTFEVPTDSGRYKVTLKLDGDALTGEASRDGQSKPAQISLKRVKPAQ
jgi:hypothetical protein